MATTVRWLRQWSRDLNVIFYAIRTPDIQMTSHHTVNTLTCTVIIHPCVLKPSQILLDGQPKSPRPTVAAIIQKHSSLHRLDKARRRRRYIYGHPIPPPFPSTLFRFPPRRSPLPSPIFRSIQNPNLPPLSLLPPPTHHPIHSPPPSPLLPAAAASSKPLPLATDRASALVVGRSSP